MDENQKPKYEITDTLIEEVISQEQYLRIGYKTVVCLFVLHDSREVLGTFASIEAGVLSFADEKKNARLAAVSQVKDYLTTINTYERAIALNAKRIKEAKENKGKVVEPSADGDSGEDNKK